MLPELLGSSNLFVLNRKLLHLLFPTNHRIKCQMAVELGSGDRPVSRYSTKIALKTHIQLGDDQCFRRLDHKVGTSQDEAVLVVQDDLRSSSACALQAIGRIGMNTRIALC
jgi:hypothetical protein